MVSPGTIVSVPVVNVYSHTPGVGVGVAVAVGVVVGVGVQVFRWGWRWSRSLYRVMHDQREVLVQRSTIPGHAVAGDVRRDDFNLEAAP